MIVARSRRRLLVLSAFLAAWAIFVFARLFQIQILRHDHYVMRAAKQQERTVTLTPVRGSVRDVRGRVLAESVVSVSIYADPQAIDDPRAVARTLASIRELDLDAKALERKLRRRGEFAWVARQLHPEVAARVKALGLNGIHSLEEHRRSYPKGMLAANILGYVGIDGEGLAGIEHSVDGYVRGRPAKVTLLRDAHRGVYLVGAGKSSATNGHHVVLTIDQVIQFIAERALRSVVHRYRANSGSVVVMDPSSGAVLALASYPTFDPNRYRDFPPSAWRNRPVQDLYEPGSTFKIVAAAGGLEEGIVTPSQIVDCGMGSIEIGNFRIREHGGHQFGLLAFEDVMAHSSNVGIIRVGLQLGPRRFYQYMRKFGFGERTGIDLPGEAVGTVRRVEKWSALSNATLSIGQELNATPVQVLQAFCAIANGGMRVDPRVVDRVVDEGGETVFTPDRKTAERVISERSAAILNEILKAVVARGTGRNAALPDHVVAGKTGTAQKAVRGGYSNDKVVASFAGYVPADRPRLAILIVVDEPKGAQYGGVIAAPVFRE
ncbi:MAG TPA: penicillin-binding protein 2, partial [Thermoanaerobaculia bacterium]